MRERRGRRISTLGSRVTSLASVGLVLLLLGMAAVGGIAGSRLEAEVRSSLGFVVLMTPDCDAVQVNGVKSCLMSHRAVESFAYTDAEEILASESAAMGRDIASELDGNPYSSEFDVRVRPQYSLPDSIDSVAAFLQTLPGVAETIAESSVIENVDTTVRRVALVSAAAGVVLLLIAIALIANTVSLSIYGRRFVIHTMKLVGATGGYIRRPFVLAGLRGGMLAGIVASLILLALRYYVPQEYPLVAELVGWYDTMYVCIGMVIFGGLITAITTIFAANKYIRASYDEMFLK